MEDYLAGVEWGARDAHVVGQFLRRADCERVVMMKDIGQSKGARVGQQDAHPSKHSQNTDCS